MDKKSRKRSGVLCLVLAILVVLVAVRLMGASAPGFMTVGLFLFLLSIYFLTSPTLPDDSTDGSPKKHCSPLGGLLLICLGATAVMAISAFRSSGAYNHDPHLTTVWLERMIRAADSEYLENGSCPDSLGRLQYYELSTPTGRWIYRVNGSKSECSIGFLHDGLQSDGKQLYTTLWTSGQSSKE